MIIPYYDRGGITIYCGDCLEIMSLLELLFDAIICDLPYGITACAWDTIIPFEPLWENYKRLVKKDGAVVLFGSQPFTSKLVVSNLEWFKVEWIWEKDKATNHLNSWRLPMKQHENILIFCSGSFLYNPQISKKPAYNIRPNSNRKQVNGDGSHTYGAFGKSKRTLKMDEQMPRSVIKVNVDKGYHPTQKPLTLLQYLIRTYTNPNDLVLDNCAGSGTTLLAAQNEGRRAVGIEISEEYCRVAVDRLRQPGFFSIPDKIEVQPKQMALLDDLQGGAK